jgi:hypothetical protein
MRRHIIAAEIIHIGKEADKLEERQFLNMNGEAQIIYGSDGSGVEELRAMLRDAVKTTSCKAVSEATGISRGHLTRIIAGEPIRTSVSRTSIVSRLRTRGRE